MSNREGFVVFIGRDQEDRQIEVTRRGLGVARGPVINQMARLGATGDVWAYYYKGYGAMTHYKRVRCGI